MTYVTKNVLGMYVCVYESVSPVKKEDTHIRFASLHLQPISILLDQLQIEAVSWKQKPIISYILHGICNYYKVYVIKSF